MMIGKVVGTVVGTKRSDEVPGAKYLLVSSCTQKGESEGDYLVALDALGAGSGEVVLVSQGSSARQTEITHKKAIDAVVVGIVDLIEERGKIVFRK